ncbi:UNVERIFIED_CONTAM: hypothetical protein Slati_0124000 [Sesamum latifolium]|uniref:Uncharacterized protein n=1 Tax=Sesamum latifolium TaxID=2727402 RepID=A0AAW2Y9A2_9LAMI
MVLTNGQEACSIGLNNRFSLIKGLKENMSAILVCCNHRNVQVPDQAWACKTMDFIEGLPKSESKDSILVAIDQFTKYGNFIALSHPFLAKTVAKVSINHMYKLTDKDKVFTSHFWQELFKGSGADLSLSTAYHP